jgi:type I restriction enzyme, S subunit
MTDVEPYHEQKTLAELLKDGLFVDGDWVESKDQDPAGEVRLIQLADVGDGVFRDRSSRYLTAAKARELRCTFLQPGDILVARMPEPLGRACIFPGVGQPAVTVVDVCIIRPNPKHVRSQWLASAINAPQTRDAMQRFVRGTTRQRISRKNLGTIAIRRPELAMQDAVADSLSRIRRKQVDAASHLAAARQAIERLRHIVLSAACSGRLTVDWRAKQEQAGSALDAVEEARARRKLELGRRYVEPSINEHSVDFELPQGWTVAPLGLLLEGIKYGTSKRSDYQSPGIAILRIPNVSRGQLELGDLKHAVLGDQEARDLSLDRTDILMIRSNGSPQLVGRSVIVGESGEGMAYAGYLMRLRPDQLIISPKYLAMALGSPEVRHQIEMPLRSTSGVNNINTSEVRSLCIAVPPLEEQAHIVSAVDRLQNLAQSVGSRVAQAEQAVDRSHQAVLAKFFGRDLSTIAPEAALSDLKPGLMLND